MGPIRRSREGLSWAKKFQLQRIWYHLWKTVLVNLKLVNSFVGQVKDYGTRKAIEERLSPLAK
jgi:hypothetical protein